MGREIRKVPKGWQHPTRREYAELELFYGSKQDSIRWADEHTPLFDKSYTQAGREWLGQARAWDDGDDENKSEYPFYWDWDGGPPDKSTYRVGKWDFAESDATCYQFYENTSEGTPLSPVFESLEELRDWLIGQGYSRDAADGFVEVGYAPSFAMIGGRFMDGVEACGEPPARSVES